MKDFTGKTAVITGGASGIGLALANAAADRQMNVVLADIQEDALNAAVEHFESRQTQVLGVVTDTSIKSSIENLYQEATAKFGNIHLLFNNAGVVNGGTPTPVWELPEQDWNWVMGVNFYGVLYGIQTFTPHMIAHGEEGHIVNTASIASFIPGSHPYGISKYSVIILSEALASDLERAKGKIGASVVCPGWVNTNIGDAERNRPDTLKSQANPGGSGLGIRELLAGSKSPEDLATHVFESVEQDCFYIFPHRGWDYLVTEHAEAMVKREGPYRFDIQAHIATRAEGKDI
ncbi:MAG: SDR family NAD(P)-dependent oxidoreductase [Pseudomonadales bacterium]|nr:SDR family NAD(P)-dependent oxidoreductase [Pseudomonadales bacterium]MBO6595845.1 SDR family NAD(P)-dependent oxidoreductase [Pseudomonadales bacterium]MBO6657846.1 SDR family NAD(P)-dependent oxidoreductase [Pseudomonadales bacterium]MBO6702450.1 SDR family NAD(P)-dependent oxidoreductase [Pseudomonadales bacterium]MBO6822329.1 SDR family NAD(P)-dependent oxidoreductase [Pseudomonadales bacterium]